MRLQDIPAIPVGQVATDDATLFMWTRLSMLEEAFWVMRAWGFGNARTWAVWDKTMASATDSASGCSTSISWWAAAIRHHGISRIGRSRR